MAQGDKFQGLALVAQNAFLDLRPSPGQEATIHNLYWANAIELYITDGTISLRFDMDASRGGRLGSTFNVTNTQWLQIKNTHSAASDIGYDGVQTK